MISINQKAVVDSTATGVLSETGRESVKAMTVYCVVTGALLLSVDLWVYIYSCLYPYLSHYVSVSICGCACLWFVGSFSRSTRNSSIDNSFPLKHTLLLLNTHAQDTPWSGFHLIHPLSTHTHAQREETPWSEWLNWRTTSSLDT